MHQLLQQIASGLATGAIYSSLALALVMIYRATELVNFAQGDMAMASTYLAWTLMNAGLPFWAAFVITLVSSFVAGVIIERVIIRPVQNAPVLAAVIVFIGLQLIIYAVTGWIFSYEVRDFASPFPDKPILGALINTRDLGVIGVTLVMLILLYVFFRYTPTGLAMRAAAQNPVSARLSGIRVGRMLAIGWGLAAAIGATAGIMVAPVLFLDPNMMLGVLIYAFAAALLGGITNPLGAVVGGLIVGVAENLIGTYLIASQLKLTVALALIFLVLVFKPNGLFGTMTVRRV
ncbi:MAG TPA: branched-chain amino acid ABC transporter permease [Magnetospirillaceae bacterium]|jgi:branched-chain amino acid transport system permease protein